MFDYARRVAEEVFIPFCVGGGIKTVEDFRRILKTGADKASINTAAVNTPELDHGMRERVRRAVRGRRD